MEIFSQLHSSGKRDDDIGEHWEEYFLELEEWNDHEHHRKAMGNGKNSLVFEEYRVEARMHRWCLKCLNSMEFENNS
jgi:hypothetical protein